MTWDLAVDWDGRRETIMPRHQRRASALRISLELTYSAR
jgi:hypothetical protein